MGTKAGALKRADYVPAEPVRRALQEWLKENDLGEIGSNAARDNYHSPYKVLADRTGIGEDACFRHAKGDRGYQSMQFDVADSFLCATNRFDWWWKDPELAECYARACQGADRIYPIVQAA